MICAEKTSQQIAEELMLSARTVEGHKNNMLQKAGVRNLVGLVLYALKKEIVRPRV